MFAFKNVVLTFIFSVLLCAACRSSGESLQPCPAAVDNPNETKAVEIIKKPEIVEENFAGSIPEDFLVTLDKPRCQGFGVCPMYKIFIKADGAVLFEGIENTKIKGKAKGKISEEKIRELIKEIEKADYFKLKDEYDYTTCRFSFTDVYNVNTSIQMNGRKNSVGHYLGCVAPNPDDEYGKKLSKLTELEDKIVEISGAQRWLGRQGR